MLYAPTGIGKTNFAIAMAVEIADGCEFLHWRGRRKARVLYIDGEMSARLMTQRLVEAVRRRGNAPTNLFIVNRIDFPIWRRSTPRPGNYTLTKSSNY